MPLSHANVLRQTSPDAHGTGPWTTSSFTPGIGKRLIVRLFAQSQSDNALAGSDLTITDSMGPLTWTPIVGTASGDSPGWGYASRAWISSATTGAGSMTLTFDAGAFGVENYRAEVEALTGESVSPVGATVVGTDADGDGAATITLSAAPEGASIVFAMAHVAVNSAAQGSVTPGAGWTEESDTTRLDWYVMQTQYRTGSGSASVDWADLFVPGAGTPLGAQMLAFEIKAAPENVLNLKTPFMYMSPIADDQEDDGRFNELDVRNWW